MFSLFKKLIIPVQFLWFTKILPTPITVYMMLRYVTDPFDVVMVLDMSLCFLITPISANCFLIYFKMLGFPPEVERGKGGTPPRPPPPPPLDEKLACPHPHVPHCFDPRMPILLFSCSFWSSCPYCPSSKSNPFGKP